MSEWRKVGPKVVTHDVPVEKVIERVVTVPHEQRIEIPIQRVVERVVQVPVDRVVERVVEVPTLALGEVSIVFGTYRYSCAWQGWE